jgi:hypothetical protein
VPPPANAPTQANPANAQPSLAFQATMLQRLFGVNATVEGALPQTLKADNPLQMINPFAPMEYGNGYDTVVLDPQRKKASGLSIISIKF